MKLLDVGFRVQDLGFRVQDLGFRVGLRRHHDVIGSIGFRV
jgi:hypothetical protein